MRKVKNFWYRVNDKVWGSMGSVGGGVGVVRKCWGNEKRCGVSAERVGRGVT